MDKKVFLISLTVGTFLEVFAISKEFVLVRYVLVGFVTGLVKGLTTKKPWQKYNKDLLKVQFQDYQNKIIA